MYIYINTRTHLFSTLQSRAPICCSLVRHFCGAGTTFRKASIEVRLADLKLCKLIYIWIYIIFLFLFVYTQMYIYTFIYIRLSARRASTWVSLIWSCASSYTYKYWWLNLNFNFYIYVYIGIYIHNVPYGTNRGETRTFEALQAVIWYMWIYIYILYVFVYIPMYVYIYTCVFTRLSARHESRRESRKLLCIWTYIVLFISIGLYICTCIHLYTYNFPQDTNRGAHLKLRHFLLFQSKSRIEARFAHLKLRHFLFFPPLKMQLEI